MGTLGMNDPWGPIVYVADADGSSVKEDAEVITGLSNADITGRVMVVHELDSGARIACGVIESVKRMGIDTQDNEGGSGNLHDHDHNHDHEGGSGKKMVEDGNQSNEDSTTLMVTI